MANYTIWTMHGEVGVNVLQENDDDVDMPDVAIHDADEEPGVNTEPMAIHDDDDVNVLVYNNFNLQVGVNVLQKNDDDVDMPDVAIHDVDEEPGVNTEPMATVNNVFRNMLADDTEDNDGIS